MATWKKIVTESNTNEISQNTTGNAATATTLQNAQNFSITGEVTAPIISFNGSSPVALSATVADNVLDVANFTDAAVVTGTEVANDSSAFANTPSGDTMLATTSAVIEYINDQGFGTGGGDMEEVTLVAGNGLNITAVGGNTSESPADTATAASGTFNATIALDLAAIGGLEISGSELKAKVDGTTIGIDASNGELQALTGAVGNSISTLATGDQIHDFVTTQGYITSSTFTVNPSGGIVVSDGGNALSTSNVNITTNENLNIGIDNLPNTSLTGNGTTHVGNTTLTLGDPQGSNASLTGMSAVQGVTNTGMAVTNLNDLDFAQNTDYTIFSTITSKTVTLGGGTSSKIRIAGDLIVSGNTTTIDTSTVQVEDKLITLARSSEGDLNTGSPTYATGGGIELDATGSINSDANPKITWTQSQGAGSIPADGSGLAIGLTGWKCRNYINNNNEDYAIAIMDYQSTSAAPTVDSAGVGAFMFDTDDDALYIRVS